MKLISAFLTVGGMTMISRVLGLAREILIAALLGAGPIAEAFFVAFRFPNLFRRFFAEGAFNMAFVPLFAKKLEGEGEADARGFAEDAMAGLLSVLFVLVLAAQLTMPWLIYAIAYGFADDPEKLSLATLFSQIQFPYLLFMSLTALVSGVLNSLGKFAAAAGAPILLNLTMIAGMGLAWSLGGSVGHYLSVSVLIAGILQFALVYHAAARAGMRLGFKAPVWTPELKRLLAIGVPAAIAGGVTQLNILIGTVVASFFDGAVAWLTYADRLYQLPLGVVGVAIGVALLPELSRCLRADDQAGSGSALNAALQFSLLLTLPAAVALSVIGEAIVALLYARGAFGEMDVAATSQALFYFALGLPAYVLNKVFSPIYFANEDTKTPLRYAVISMVVNTAMSIGLAFAIGWLAIPIATAAAAWVNVLLLWIGVEDKNAYRITVRTQRRLLAAACASVIMGSVLYLVGAHMQDQVADPLLRIPAVLGLVALGMAVYAACAFALGAVSPSQIRSMLRRRGKEEA
ncbi:MAG: murein biosynthesis integral membrane protein MurJ [Neomegalonema sp.]|nr:murein biosynthesis integral membrane protein MurJ [Neomegalonema sp.]